MKCFRLQNSLVHATFHNENVITIVQVFISKILFYLH